MPGKGARNSANAGILLAVRERIPFFDRFFQESCFLWRGKRKGRSQYTARRVPAKAIRRLMERAGSSVASICSLERENLCLWNDFLDLFHEVGVALKHQDLMRGAQLTHGFE